MPAMYTPSQCRNMIERSLNAVLDPHPSKDEVNGVWSWFGNKCAYCGRALSREEREGDLDHLTKENGNGIGNRVLACKTCNGDERRDQDWPTFLREKAGPDAAVREKRIRKWMAKNRMKPMADAQRDALATAVARVRKAFDLEVRKLRQLRRGAGD